MVLLIVVILGTPLLYYTLQFQYNSSGEVGKRGRDLLRSAPYFSIVVEIDYMSGHKPDPDALLKFAEFIQEHSRKSVEFIQSEIPANPGKEYTQDDIANLYDQYRSVTPFPGTIALYVIYLDRPFSDPKVGAAAFCATCIAVFSPVKISSMLERVVLAHEFLHLTGLCALTYTDVRSHCDSGHSTNSGSLMAAAPDWRNNLSVQQLKLLPNELADLEGLRSGTL